MRKTFVSNLILLLSLNLLVKPAYLLLVEAEIQNRVGPAEFGGYFALINFSFLLNIIPDLGITNWNTRNIARHGHLLSRYFPAIFSLRVILALLYILVATTIGFFFNYSREQMGVLMVLSFNQVLSTFIMYLRSNLTALHLFVQDSIVSVLDRVLLLLMMTYLLVTTTCGYFNIHWLIWGQTVAYGITALVTFVLVVRKSGLPGWKFSIAGSIAILKQSAPFALLIFTSMLAYRADSVMLERMRPDGAHQAGLYAMGFRFFEAYNMIAYLFAVLLLPIFARMLKQNQDVSALTALAFKLLFAATWTVTVICILFGKDILNLFYTDNLESADPAFRWLMVGILGFSMQYVFGTLLTAAGKLKALILVSLGAFVLNLLLNLLWIPQYGAQGSAWANAITQNAMLIADMVLVYKVIGVRPKTALVLNTLIFSTLILAIGWLCTINQLPFAYSVAFMAVGALVVAFGTRMIDLKKFVQLLKTSEKPDGY